MTWTQGHRLKSYSDDYSDDYITYTYNSDGIRTSRTVNGVKHNYTLNGTRILSEDWTVSNVQHLLVFIYDAAGSPVGFRYRNSNTNAFGAGDFKTYYYGKNLEGDVLYVFNSAGTKVAEYKYDAWGKCSAAYYGQSSNPGVTFMIYGLNRYEIKKPRFLTGFSPFSGQKQPYFASFVAFERQ